MAETVTQQRIPESGQKSGWSIETAIDYLFSVINEKHAHVLTLVTGNDKRYEERFLASQKALELGLAGQKSEISAALAAADRAVLKAEAATEKRFESVNEFRGTLDQQQRTLIPRSEVDVLFRGMNEKHDAAVHSLDAKIDILQKQYDGMQSERAGVKGGWAMAVAGLGAILTLGAIIVMIINFSR